MPLALVTFCRFSVSIFVTWMLARCAQNERWVKACASESESELRRRGGRGRDKGLREEVARGSVRARCGRRSHSRTWR